MGQKEGRGEKEEKEEKEGKDVPKDVSQRRVATNTQRKLFYRMTGLRAPFKRMTGIVCLLFVFSLPGIKQDVFCAKKGSQTFCANHPPVSSCGDLRSRRGHLKTLPESSKVSETFRGSV